MAPSLHGFAHAQQYSDMRQQCSEPAFRSGAGLASKHELDGPAPRAPTRVPSLVFDIELEEAGSMPGAFSETDSTLGVKELRRWLLPSSTGELQLRADVEQALRSRLQLQQAKGCAGSPESGMAGVERVASYLSRRGYNVSIRTALGGGDGTDCLRNLRHVFLTVLPPGAHATTNRFVVDLSFKEQFCIAKPTPHYQALLDCLPDAYVAPEAAIAPLVSFLCQEMAAAFRALDAVLPPWRAASSMLSKWLPRKSMEEQVSVSMMTGTSVLSGNGALASGHLSQGPSSSMRAKPQAGTGNKPAPAPPPPAMVPWATAGSQCAPAAAAAAQALAALAPTALPRPHMARKPLVCEPQRVVVGGNFSAIGFP